MQPSCLQEYRTESHLDILAALLRAELGSLAYKIGDHFPAADFLSGARWVHLQCQTMRVIQDTSTIMCQQKSSAGALQKIITGACMTSGPLACATTYF